MNAWTKIAALALVCAVALCACTSSPAPDTQTPPGPQETASPTETQTLIPAPSRETSEDPPEETPEPAPEATLTPWPVNADIGLSVTTWNESYKEGGDLCLTASISLPAFSGVSDSIPDFYAYLLEDLQRSAQGWADMAKAEKADGSLTRPYAINQSFTVECNSARIISVRRMGELDMGGMHADTTVWCETFSADSGIWLNLDDFFTVPSEEYISVLLDKVIGELGKNTPDYFEDWRETAERELPRAAFCVSPEGLSFFYPELTLGPYALGVVRADIPWGDLEGIWTFPE